MQPWGASGGLWDNGLSQEHQKCVCLAPLGGFGAPFSAPLDLEGGPNRLLLSMKRSRLRTVPRTISNYDGNLMRKVDVLIRKQKCVRWILDAIEEV